MYHVIFHKWKTRRRLRKKTLYKSKTVKMRRSCWIQSGWTRLKKFKTWWLLTDKGFKLKSYTANISMSEYLLNNPSLCMTINYPFSIKSPTTPYAHSLSNCQIVKTEQLNWTSTSNLSSSSGTFCMSFLMRKLINHSWFHRKACISIDCLTTSTIWTPYRPTTTARGTKLESLMDKDVLSGLMELFISRWWCAIAPDSRGLLSS